jgi:hypothetical protein
MGMDEAPERIWAAPDTDDGWRWPVASKFPMQGYAPDGQVAYVRADILAQTLAANAALVKRLEEARGVLHFYADFHENPNDGPWGVNSQDFGKAARAFLAGGE